MKQKILELPRATWNFIRTHWMLSLVVVIALAGIFFFYQKSQAKKAQEEKVIFEQVQRGDLIKTIQVSGVVDAKKRARLSFAAGGKLVYLGVEEGQAVEKWDTIATIDRAALSERLDTELNNYLIERLDWENTRDTYIENDSGQAGPIPELTDRRLVEQEQARLNNSVNAVEIQSIAIRDTVLSAPFSGIITQVPTPTAGVQLGLTDFFEIVDPSTLTFRAFVDEEDISLIQESDLGVIELDAFEDTPISSTISYVAFTSTPTTSGTTFVVELPVFERTALPIRIGMNGEVEIEVARRSDALFVPINATRERDDTVYVDVQTGEDTFEERALETGIETDEYIEVLSGLSDTDSIVIP